jgi:glutaredoxin
MMACSPRHVTYTLLGLVALTGGAELTVGAAASVARALGVSEVVIGLTVLAVGTSLPELVASVVATMRGQAELAIGNVVGSNIFNILLVGGVTSVVRPIPIPAGGHLDLLVVAVLSLMLLGVSASANRQIIRGEAMVLLTAYVERYLSTPLFEGVSAEMTDAELALSCSTPGYRFDVQAAPAAPTPAVPLVLDADAERFVTETVATQGVVMFALEWCEFCWSARTLFARLGIPYRSVDLASGAYQTDDLGGRIRQVLLARTGVPTIPRIYVGGEHVGGCTELFDAWNEGSLQSRLAAADVVYDSGAQVDAYSLMPRWLHPRKSA